MGKLLGSLRSDGNTCTYCLFRPRDHRVLDFNPTYKATHFRHKIAKDASPTPPPPSTAFPTPTPAHARAVAVRLLPFFKVRSIRELRPWIADLESAGIDVGLGAEDSLATERSKGAISREGGIAGLYGDVEGGARTDVVPMMIVGNKRDVPLPSQGCSEAFPPGVARIPCISVVSCILLCYCLLCV